MSLMQVATNVLVRNHVHIKGTDQNVLFYAHGFGCNQTMWDAVTPAFAATHKQVLFDYVGSGQSDISAFDSTRYSSLDGYAQDVLDVCDALGLQEGVTFIGHSVSCSIGILASIRRPKLFKQLVLLGPNPCFVNHAPEYVGGFERKDLQELLELMDKNYIGWAQYLAPVVAGPDGGVTVSGKLSESFCSTDPVVARIFAQTTFFSDNREDLPFVTCPSLILQHRQDSLAPLAVGDYLHRHLSGSTLQILEAAGHCAHMSHPELVVKAIRDFIERSD
jgi:sigma-B regulation protein RsbQ